MICTLEFTEILTDDAIICKYVSVSGSISFHEFSGSGPFFHYAIYPETGASVRAAWEQIVGNIGV